MDGTALIQRRIDLLIVHFILEFLFPTRNTMELLINRFVQIIHLRMLAIYVQTALQNTQVHYNIVMQSVFFARIVFFNLRD